MTTKLKHPESKRTIEVDDDSVRNYESQGWEPVESPTSGSKAK